jgi:hypothetical protein
MATDVQEPARRLCPAVDAVAAGLTARCALAADGNGGSGGTGDLPSGET